jgi:hypothetical protein
MPDANFHDRASPRRRVARQGSASSERAAPPARRESLRIILGALRYRYNMMFRTPVCAPPNCVWRYVFLLA